MTRLSFLSSLQKTRHPTAGGNTTYRLTVSHNKLTTIMRHFILTLTFVCICRSIFGQTGLDINYETIKATINDKESNSYYPKILERFNTFDSTLTLQDYSLIYYGFSFQNDYLKSKPDEKILNDLLKAIDYEKAVQQCQKILDSNPVSLLANNKMGFSLFKLNKPEADWKKYQNRYRMIRKVIVYSGNGLTCETAFKVIYVSDEYNILYDYFEIPKIHRQILVGLCDKFEIDTSEYYKVEEMYFDTSRELFRQQQLIDNK
jgi:tetratricopeptide (TPR) repeat protein